MHEQIALRARQTLATCKRTQLHEPEIYQLCKRIPHACRIGRPRCPAKLGKRYIARSISTGQRLQPNPRPIRKGARDRPPTFRCRTPRGAGHRDSWRRRCRTRSPGRLCRHRLRGRSRRLRHASGARDRLRLAVRLGLEGSQAPLDGLPQHLRADGPGSARTQRAQQRRQARLGAGRQPYRDLLLGPGQLRASHATHTIREKAVR